MVEATKSPFLVPSNSCPKWPKWPKRPMLKKLAPYDPKLRGVPLLVANYNFIFAHPEQWRQDDWSRPVHCKIEGNETFCGTAFCFAGWIAYICGVGSDAGIAERARYLLGLSVYDSSWLFAGDRDLREIHHFVKTKLQEACFFAKKAMASRSENQA